MSNHSFSAPPPVAVRFEHNPQEDSTLSQRAGVEVSYGRAAAGGPSKDGFPLPKMEYRDLEGTIIIIFFFPEARQGYTSQFSVYYML